MSLTDVAGCCRFLLFLLLLAVVLISLVATVCTNSTSRVQSSLLDVDSNVVQLHYVRDEVMGPRIVVVVTMAEEIVAMLVDVATARPMCG